MGTCCSSRAELPEISLEKTSSLTIEEKIITNNEKKYFLSK